MGLVNHASAPSARAFSISLFLDDAVSITTLMSCRSERQRSSRRNSSPPIRGISISHNTIRQGSCARHSKASTPSAACTTECPALVSMSATLTRAKRESSTSKMRCLVIFPSICSRAPRHPIPKRHHRGGAIGLVIPGSLLDGNCHKHRHRCQLIGGRYGCPKPKIPLAIKGSCRKPSLDFRHKVLAPAARLGVGLAACHKPEISSRRYARRIKSLAGGRGCCVDGSTARRSCTLLGRVFRDGKSSHSSCESHGDPFNDKQWVRACGSETLHARERGDGWFGKEAVVRRVSESHEWNEENGMSYEHRESMGVNRISTTTTTGTSAAELIPTVRHQSRKLLTARS